MRAPRILLPAVFTVLFASGSSAAELKCGGLTMAMTATFPDDPGFEGLYKYTLSGSWDAALSGLSRVELSLSLGDCACACDAGVTSFSTPAGASAGRDLNAHACEVGYAGSYTCKRAPSALPELQTPIVEFSAGSGACRTESAGAGAWHFYSPFPPAPAATYPNLVAVKSDGAMCAAALTGQVPLCRCPTRVETSTWGRMKSLYR
jgi:hypothetical protein